MDSLENERFQKRLEALEKSFKRSLQGQLSERTIRRHGSVIQLLIDYLCWDCNVSSFAAIQRGMVCSRFRQWYCCNIQDLTESQVNTAVRKFFTFLVHEKGILIGPDVMKGLKIKAPEGTAGCVNRSR